MTDAPAGLELAGLALVTTAEATASLVRRLRRAGFKVAAGDAVVFAHAWHAVGSSNADDVYWSARATLCRRPEDRERFDGCFLSWITAVSRFSGQPADDVGTAILALDGEDDSVPVDTDDANEVPVVAVRFSPSESLRHREFATYSPADHAEARRVLADLRVEAETRRSRRLKPAHARRRPDVRRTVRAAMRTDGEPVRRAYRAPARRPRRLILLCDVSGSMEPYSRVILRFVHSATVARNQVEVFALGTRLTRVTRELANRDPDAAIAAASRRVVDWSGGTRLGATLREFNRTWGIRGMARGAVVVIISDGWDRGEPEMLAAEMQRLARVTHRIVWINPLKASPGYVPLAAGMAAALPYVDDFLEGHSLASLSELAAVLRPGRVSVS